MHKYASLIFFILFYQLLFAEETYYRINSKDGLNLHENPSFESKVITTIPDKNKVTVISESNFISNINGISDKWKNIRWKNNKGWAWGGYIKHYYSDKLKVLRNHFYSNQIIEYDKSALFSFMDNNYPSYRTSSKYKYKINPLKLNIIPDLLNNDKILIISEKGISSSYVNSLYILTHDYHEGRMQLSFDYNNMKNSISTIIKYKDLNDINKYNPQILSKSPIMNKDDMYLSRIIDYINHSERLPLELYFNDSNKFVENEKTNYYKLFKNKYNFSAYKLSHNNINNSIELLSFISPSDEDNNFSVILCDNNISYFHHSKIIYSFVYNGVYYFNINEWRPRTCAKGYILYYLDRDLDELKYINE